MSDGMARDVGDSNADHGIRSNGLGEVATNSTRDAMSGVRRRNNLSWIRTEHNAAFGGVRTQLI